jgi:two-component system, cell cycle response regulator DivK
MTIIAPPSTVVLVVEDNPDNQLIILSLLEDDCNIPTCHGVAAGWQLFKMLREHAELQPQIILLDLQIPGENGYGVLQRIRATRSLVNTRVVAVTANVMPQDVEKCRLAGFDGFIGKPINAERFPLQIQRILEGEAVWEPR